MRRRKRIEEEEDDKQIELGWINIPKGYEKLSQSKKDFIVNTLIERILFNIDKDLPPHINRLTFLDEVFESSLITNEKDENYEVCMVIRDARKKLNED